MTATTFRVYALVKFSSIIRIYTHVYILYSTDIEGSGTRKSWLGQLFIRIASQKTTGAGLAFGSIASPRAIKVSGTSTKATRPALLFVLFGFHFGLHS